MTNKQERFLGVPVGALTRQELLDDIGKQIERGAKSTLIAINPEKILTAQKNETLKRLIEEATYRIPDGIGVLIASRLKGGAITERIPGIEMFEELVKLADENRYPVFLYGAKEEIVKTAAGKLQERYPGLLIAGSLNGYQQDEEAVVREIRASGAKMLFIAKGSPRQELWIEEHMASLPDVLVFQGVGGSFDVLAGKVKRAPQSFQRLGLEWLYRLLQEPSRIKRQLLLPVFLLRVMVERVKQRS